MQSTRDPSTNQLLAVSAAWPEGGGLRLQVETERQSLEAALDALGATHHTSGLGRGAHWLAVCHPIGENEGLLAVANLTGKSPRILAGNVHREADRWPLGFAVRQLVADDAETIIDIPPVWEQIRDDAPWVEAAGPLFGGDPATLFLALWLGRPAGLRVRNPKSALGLAILAARTGQTLRLAIGEGERPKDLSGAWLFAQVIEAGAEAAEFNAEGTRGAVHDRLAGLLAAHSGEAALRLAGLCSIKEPKLRDLDKHLPRFHDEVEGAGDLVEVTLDVNFPSLRERFGVFYRQAPEGSGDSNEAPAEPSRDQVRTELDPGQRHMVTLGGPATSASGAAVQTTQPIPESKTQGAPTKNAEHVPSGTAPPRSASDPDSFPQLTARPRTLPPKGSLLRRWLRSLLSRFGESADTEACWDNSPLFCPFCGNRYRFSEITHVAIRDRDERVVKLLENNSQWQNDLPVAVKNVNESTRNLLRNLREMFNWRDPETLERSFVGTEDHFAQNLWDLVRRAASAVRDPKTGQIAPRRMGLALRVAIDESEERFGHPSQELAIYSGAQVLTGHQPELCCPMCLSEIPLSAHEALQVNKRFLHARSGFVALLGVARSGKTVLLSTLLSPQAKPPDSAESLRFIPGNKAPEINEAIRLMSKNLRSIGTTRLPNFVWSPMFLELRFPIDACHFDSVSLVFSDIPGEEVGPTMEQGSVGERMGLEPMLRNMRHASLIMFIVDLQAPDDVLDHTDVVFNEIQHRLTNSIGIRKIPLILLLTKADGYCLSGPWPSTEDQKLARHLARRLQSRSLRAQERSADLKSFLEEDSRWLADWMLKVERLQSRAFTEALNKADGVFGSRWATAISSIGTATYLSTLEFKGRVRYEYCHSARPVLLDLPFIQALISMEEIKVPDDGRLEPRWFRMTSER